MFGSLAKAIIAGRFQAALVAVVFAVLALFLPPFSLISGGAIGLVTLRLGWQQGLSVAGLGILALAALSLLVGDPMIGVAYGMSQWLPVVLLALLLRHNSSWTVTFQMAVGVLAVMVLLAHVVIPDLGAHWQSLLGQVLEPMLKQAGSEQAADLKKIVQEVSGVMTGVLAVSILMSSILALFLARAWQAQLFNPGGFGEEFRALRLGNWLALAGIILFALSVVMKQHNLQELAILFLVPFMFQGLAVMHELNRKFQWHAAILIIMYVLMFIALPQMMAMLIAMGLIDSFADFRRRLNPKAG
jgi:hypothetical protein